MDTSTRLEKLRKALCLDWNGLGEHLELSRSMLHAIRQGSRAFSPKVEGRIRELEIRAGIRPRETSPMIVREDNSPYNVPPQKQAVTLAEVESLERIVQQLAEQILDMRRRIEKNTK